MDKFIGFICCLLYPSLPFIGSSKCRTVPQGFLWNVSVLTARGENHAAANLNSEANINTANTDGSLQVETKLIGSITMKTAASLCFANILLGQTEFSTDRATLGYILFFWQTPSWPSIDTLVALVPGPDSAAGRILCTKNNQKIAFSVNVILSFCSKG